MWRLNERKEITLTPGGLTRVPDKRDGISHRNKLASDDKLNCKKSAEAIVVHKNEGLNNSNLED
jgi:hypothetical protein